MMRVCDRCVEEGPEILEFRIVASRKGGGTTEYGTFDLHVTCLKEWIKLLLDVPHIPNGGDR